MNYADPTLVRACSRALLRGFALEQRTVRRRELIAPIAFRPGWQRARMRIGVLARYALLADAFVRGRPYRAVELRCHPDSPAQVGALLHALAMVSSSNASDRALVAAWLAVPATKARLDRDQSARATAAEQRAARREAARCASSTS